MKKKIKKVIVALKKKIKQQGSQEAVARELGVSWGTINRWVNGKVKPTGLYLKVLMEYLKL